jgi:uncharacterized repeat protein (TIGR02543 family)
LPTQGTKTIGQTFQLAAATGITKNGFTFGGWSDGTNTYTAGTNYTVGAANVTLTALWINTYLITYDKNGATAGTAPDLASYVTGATGITLAGAGDLLKNGYTFNGWSITPTGTAVSSPYTVSANTTLYAKWALSTININFAAGTANSAPATPVTLPSNTSAVFGSLYQLPNSSTASVTAGGNVYVFSGWSYGGATYQVGSEYRMTATAPTFTAQWIQDSLYGTGAGDRSKKLTWNISAGEEIDATVSADNGSSIRVVIPANALDAGTEVVFWRLLNQNIGLEKVSAANNYFLNIGVSWTIGDDLTSPKTVQVANSPIRMTIVNAVIERGAKAWQVVKGVSTLIGTATNAGQMDVAFRDDPLIVAANVDPEPVAQPQQQVAVPVVVPVIEPPVVVTPIVAKTFKSQVKVFFGLGTAWLAPKEKNTLTKFVKDFAGKNQIVDVAVAGYTQPTLVNPNPQKLSVDRAKAVVKALKALGINAKISAVGKGNAKTNKPTSRYALLTITGTIRA